MAIAEDLAIIHEPDVDDAFKVEQHGIDFIPESERWATPRDIFGMWAGVSVQIEYFIYGAILMTFGLTFAQVVIIIVLGNLSYFLLGLCSLQGPNTGTTVFAINRAPFGPNGSRPISFFNWITQIGFEVEGLILIVGVGLVLMVKSGFMPGDPAKVFLVIVAVLIQGILPFLGHAAIVKTLRWLVIPFVILFAVMLGFAIPHANLHVVKTSGDWQGFMEALAFTIALSGLGWTECGNDYTRYCPTNTSKKGIVGWVFLGTAVPEILIMTLGALVGTFVLHIGTGAGGFLTLHPPERHPLMVRRRVPGLRRSAVVRNQQPGHVLVRRDHAGDGYPGEALPGRPDRLRHRPGHHDVRRLQLVLHQYLEDFVDIVIVWIAPWGAIFLVDWALRRYRYVPSELQNTGRTSLYWRKGGIFWPALVAQLIGMFAAISALSATFHLPQWLNLVTYHTRDAYGYGGDFSVFLGHGRRSGGLPRSGHTDRAQGG